MIQERPKLAEVVSMVQVFRMDQNRWPLQAAELFAFSLFWGKPLDYSGLHTLIFFQENSWHFGLEYVISKEGDESGSCGRLELTRVGQTDQEMTFAWQTRYLPLPPKRLKSSTFCLIK